jgi:hypothetical protein
MTRAAKLKQTVRARARKTGESYTAARRQVLAARVKAAAPAPASAPDARAASPAKGAVSDARVRATTGHGLDHWFAVLDAFGAVERGHTAAARHIQRDHGVSAWYSQGITVAYERARGVRTLNQLCSGDFAVSVSKVVGAPPAGVADAFARHERRARWLAAAPDLLRALDAGLAAPKSKGVRVRDGKDARLRYTSDGVTVEVRLDPKPDGRTTVVVDTTKLRDAAAVERHRAAWRAALTALAAHVS